MDADKEGFLRSERSLIQTAGRAARNLNGKVIFYANSITRSMQAAIDETGRRRKKQIKFNKDNNQRGFMTSYDTFPYLRLRAIFITNAVQGIGFSILMSFIILLIIPS